MITVPALKVRQFGVEFYQTSFTSRDIQRLVQFEVLSYSTVEEKEKQRKTAKTSAVTGTVGEKDCPERGGLSETCYPKEIRELVQYYRECQEAQICLPFRAR